MKRTIALAAGVSAAAIALALGPAGSALAHNDHLHGMGKSKAVGGGGPGSKLSYHGGIGGAGVEHNAKLYIVYYGTQWTAHTSTTHNGYAVPSSQDDPSGEAVRQLDFLSGLYGSNEHWSTSTTQYCDGSVATGATSCPNGAGFVVHPGSNPVVATWFDTQHGAAVDKAADSEVQQAAKDAAAHFTGYDPLNAEFIIDTPHNANLAGFYTQYCAYHDYEAYNGGNIAFTNMPYLTDQGASCGQNFVNSGSAGTLDGVTIVGGHEYAESVSDHYPNTAWADNRLSENGDKCAWKTPGTSGGAANVTTANGSFPVQSLWSNSLGSRGGCAIYYVSATNQHG